MKKWIIVILLFACVIQPVSALEFTAPAAPEGVQPLMPEERESFAEDLWYIVKTAITALRPELAEAAKRSFALIAVVLLLSVLNNITKQHANTIRLTGAVTIGVMLLQPINTFIQLGADTVVSVSEYGKLLLPVMTAALAAQGGTTTSVALYTATVFFDNFLTGVIAKVIVPALYIQLCLCIVVCAVQEDMLGRVRDFIKSTMTWCLKTVLYFFTGYISITGVVSGVVDSSVIKATKLTISGVVPVVGGILSDASETILVSAGVMKNAAGIYGILAVMAICITPFLQIGIQYLLLKATAAISGIFGYKPAVSLIEDFSTGMGFVLAMTGTVSILLLISLVCFMKGIG